MSDANLTQPSITKSPDLAVIATQTDGVWIVKISSKPSVPFTSRDVKLLIRALSVQYRTNLRDARLKVRQDAEMKAMKSQPV